MHDPSQIVYRLSSWGFLLGAFQTSKARMKIHLYPKHAEVMGIVGSANCDPVLTGPKYPSFGYLGLGDQET